MSSNIPHDAPRPRLCEIKKWSDFNGYGFNLHAEKGKAGQFIGKVDLGSPALYAGMKERDRLIEVNGVNIGNENHSQVVQRIKASGSTAKLLVLDPEADMYYRERKIVVRGDFPNVVFAEAPDENPASQPINGNSVDEVSHEVEDLKVYEPEEPKQEESTVSEVEASPPVESEVVVEAAQVDVETAEVESEEREVSETQEVVVDVGGTEEQVHEEPSMPEYVRDSTPPREHSPPPEENIQLPPTYETAQDPSFTQREPSPPRTQAAAASAQSPTSPDPSGLKLGLSVAEMREQIRKNKKRDAKKSEGTFQDKFAAFQRL